MLSDDDLKKIKRAANRVLESDFSFSTKSNVSTDLSESIAKAIAQAIKEYDSIRNR